jgi:hypothetical protein
MTKTERPSDAVSARCALSARLRYLRRLAAGLCAALGAWLAAPAWAVSTTVVISEFRTRGPNGGNDEFVELFNLSAAPVNIGGWRLNASNNAGTTGTRATITAGTLLNPGCRYLLTNSGASGYSGTVTGNQTYTTGITDDGGVALLDGTLAIVDAVGMSAGSAYREGTVLAPTTINQNQSQERRPAGQNSQDGDNNAADFLLNAGSSNPQNLASTCTPAGGDAAPAVAATFPANGAVGVATNANASITFSEPVNLGPGAFALSCTLSGSKTFAQSPGPTSFTIDPDIDFVTGEQCTLTVSAAAVTDQDSIDPPDAMAANFVASFTVGSGLTPIFDIQGSGTTSPVAGLTLSTSGVVTRVNNNGFFIQDPAGDGNPLTSDGIFVFTGSAPAVLVGQLVQLTGLVVEFNPGAAGNPDTSARPVTELTTISGLTVLSSGNTITPTPFVLPEAANDELERVEGMLVTLSGPLTASQNFFLGRFGQVTLSSGGRLENPTNRHRPGALAQSLFSENARRRILLDDGSSQQNPNPTPFIGADNTLRAGDTVAALTGVIDYGLATADSNGFGDYKIHPTQPVSFTRANARTPAPALVGGNLKVASFNVLNYFTTFTDGSTAAGGSGQGCAPSNTTADCRGANNLAEFNRQRDKIVPALLAIDADVVGLMEIQNNGNTAVQNLVDRLNAVLGSNTYAAIGLPGGVGTGTDAIRVAMIYKPARLTTFGAALADADPVHNRPPLAQTFTLNNGQRITVAVNHFKSKSCTGAAGAELDQGDLQGCFNAQRLAQAQALRSFIASVQASSGVQDTLVIGDLNAYAQEDPIFALTSNGFVDQIGRFSTLGYTFTFDGAAGRLDHAIATAGLSAKVTGALAWPINTDEPSFLDYNLEFKQPACAACAPDLYSATPYRSSDHDPVVVGIALQSAQTISFASLADRSLAASPFTVVATSSAGLPVVFSSLTPAFCTVSGSTVSLLAVGTCSIAADQAGNADIAPAPQVVRAFAVLAGGSAAQTIAFDPLPDRVLGSAPFALVATASSGLPVSFSALTSSTCSVSGTTVSLNAAGGCTIAADQPGDATWAAAPQVPQSFSIGTGSGASHQVPLPWWAIALLAGLLFGTAARMQRRLPP